MASTVSLIERCTRNENQEIDSFLISNSCLSLPRVLIFLVSQYASDRVVKRIQLEVKIHSLIVTLNVDLQKMLAIAEYNDKHSKKLALPDHQTNVESDLKKLDRLIEKYTQFRLTEPALIEDAKELKELHTLIIR
jgi:hypothetical protein